MSVSDATQMIEAMKIKKLYCYKCKKTVEVDQFLGDVISRNMRYLVYRLKCGHIRRTQRNLPTMKMFTIHFPPNVIERIQFLVLLGRYSSIAHFIRYAVYRFLNEEYEGIRREKEVIKYFLEGKR